VENWPPLAMMTVIIGQFILNLRILFVFILRVTGRQAELLKRGRWLFLIVKPGVTVTVFNSINVTRLVHE